MRGLVLYNSIRFAAFETQAMFRQFELYKTNLTPIPFQLLDWTGRQIRHGKRGVIAENTPTVLNRLNISPEHWIELATNFESHFKGLVGSAHAVERMISQFGLNRKPNYSNSLLLFG